MKLEFPAVAEDLSDAFNNAIDAGVMDRDDKSRNFWAQFELVASDVEDDEVVADWFHCALSNVFTRVMRTGKENST